MKKEKFERGEWIKERLKVLDKIINGNSYDSGRWSMILHEIERKLIQESMEEYKFLNKEFEEL